MKVGIFGCGWLGQALAKRLKKRHTVFGAVRSETSLQRLYKQNIEVFQNPDKESSFWDVDTLVISISPRQNYLESLEKIALNCRDSVKQVVLLSSTSVYGDAVGRVDEESYVESGSMVSKGEVLFRQFFPDGVIVRLGGLMGPDRIAGQWGSKMLQDAPVNYIHREDAVGILEQIIEKNIQNEIINAVAPKHPKRSEVYKQNCEQFGFELPLFKDGKERVVLSEKSRELLGYNYCYEDPMRFWLDS